MEQTARKETHDHRIERHDSSPSLNSIFTETEVLFLDLRERIGRLFGQSFLRMLLCAATFGYIRL